MDLLRVLKDIMRQEKQLESAGTVTVGTYPGSLRQMIIRDAFRKERGRLRRNKILYAIVEGAVIASILAGCFWLSR